MPRTPLTGTRIRERRLLAGLGQAELARAAGVSPSYLNLIEHNRRRVGADLLARLAAGLQLDPAALTEAAGAVLLDRLRDAAAQQAAGGADVVPELEQAAEFAERFPGWAALMAAQQARIALLERSVERLSDRMAHDPYLSTALHDVLSALTAVRATAAILAETEDIDPVWRARFHRNLAADSLRLSTGAGALVGYLDGDGAATEAGALATPQEEVERWLEALGHHIPALEGRAAEPAGPVVAALVAEATALRSPAAQDLAIRYLTRYAEEARALPQAALRRALADRPEPDPGQLAAAFGTDSGLVLRRLAALPELGAGLLVCDGSGTLIHRKPVDGFGLPRFGAACPLWPLYQALTRPGLPLRVVVDMAGRVSRRFLTFALCQARHPGGFDAPPVLEAAMLILPLSEPARAETATLPVGTTCRICPRAACPARREPSVLGEGV